MNFITEDGVVFESTVNTPNADIISELKAGIYVANVFKTQNGVITRLQKINTDQYKRIESGVFKEVLNHYEKFFSPETRELYKNMKISHKSNLLLYGPPGTGKSGLAYLIANEMVKTRNAIAIYVKDSDAACYIAERIKKDAERPLLFIEEEIDREIEQDGPKNLKSFEFNGTKVFINMSVEASGNLLTFLDSPMSHENFCFIATTNYIEDIPLSLRNRPSRFEIVKEVAKLPEGVVHELVDKLIPAEIAQSRNINVKEFKYKLTESDITIDQVKTAIVMHVIHGRSIDQSVADVIALKEVDEQEAG